MNSLRWLRRPGEHWHRLLRTVEKRLGKAGSNAAHTGTASASKPLHPSIKAPDPASMTPSHTLGAASQAFHVPAPTNTATLGAASAAAASARRSASHSQNGVDPQQLGASESQSRTALIANVVAIAALAVAGFALLNQVQTNRQQSRLNDKQQDLKYSSRVALWARPSTAHSSVLPDGFDVTVQNRSPVPMRELRIYAQLKGSAQLVGVGLVDIPPCTIEVHRIAPPEGGTFDAATKGSLILEFVVDQKSWQLAADKLTIVKAWTPLQKPGLRQRRMTSENAGDCGEGG